MADKLVASKDDTSVIEKYVDNGDGSWSRKVAVGGGAVGAAGYPAGATPVNSFPANGAGNTAVVATLPGVAGKTTYITGVDISYGGATASGLAGFTLGGLLGGTPSWIIPVPAGPTLGGQLSLRFNPPIPASGLNTSITATLSALGSGNAAAMVAAYGFQI
jgi:hypothetical protein